MIIDLKEVQKLEKKYQNDQIALNSLQVMVNIVSNQTVENLTGSIALATLMELGVLTKAEPKTEQINS